MKIDAVKTLETIKKKLHDSGDFKSRTVRFFDTDIALCYIADITDNQLLNDSVIFPIVNYDGEKETSIVSTLQDKVLSNQEVLPIDNLDEAIEKLLVGNTLILVDGANKILGCDIEKITVRAVTEPPTSVVVKGPREGFTESLKYNLALIRKRVHSADFVVQNLEIGG